jgi:hypothetical protein
VVVGRPITAAKDPGGGGLKQLLRKCNKCPKGHFFMPWPIDVNYKIVYYNAKN